VPTASDIEWFKREFGPEIRARADGTPFTVDMLAAIACQETGYIWSGLRRRGLSTPDVLKLCVGDSIDGKADGTGRRAFPKTRSELELRADGANMFAIARQALVDMSTYVQGYGKAVQNPNKFCRGYGIFQYDLQHFVSDPRYFLDRRYEQFGDSLAKCIAELSYAQRRVGLAGRASLTESEMTMVAIAYNRGSYKPTQGLKQGHFDGQRYYGEAFVDYLRLAKTVAEPGRTADLPAPANGEAIISPPTTPAAAGDRYLVDTRVSHLRVRSEPRIDRRRPRANVIRELPDGHPVRAVGTAQVNGFLEIETSFQGALIRGYASTKYLRKVRAVPADAIASPPQPLGSIPEAHLARKAGSVTRRTDPAGAYSLNEPNQPGRTATTPEKLRAELAGIIEWLAVELARHRRYAGGGGKTFCNIYTHDYCHLAGVYLPRVWWNGPALQRLATGQAVKAIYGQTVDELRANDLFRWLRDFGQAFGWRQTGTLTKLQAEVNEGAVGLIVARRRIDGRSGHIVAVVPETDTQRARRDGAGEVVSPLQSQAGVTNFRYGYGRPRWWQGDEFAEHAFWIHA
jgi:hypothetical protein